MAPRRRFLSPRRAGARCRRSALLNPTGAIVIGPIAALSRWLTEMSSWLRARFPRRSRLRPSLPAQSPEQTLADTIHKKGYASFTTYANSAPLTSLKDLAERLGGEEWVLHTRLLIEAERNSSVESYARSLFIRYLHQGTTPDKYFGMLGPSWAVDLALYRTALTLPRRYRLPCMRVALGYMRADIGFDWKPQSAHDPVVEELFATYWPESSMAFFAPLLRLRSRLHSRLPRLAIDDDDDGGGSPPPTRAA
jgi:hypothetical protein